MSGLTDQLEVLCGLAILLGILGTVLPVLPGALLIGGSVLVWALLVAQDAAGWVTFALVVALLVAGQVVKYYTAGRHMTASGVPGRTLMVAGVAGIVGFFVVPVIGLVLFFVLALYLAERYRMGTAQGARRSTVTALKAVGLSILVELAAALGAGAVWLTAVLNFT